MEYRISIIMGIYNCEKTLEEAIESLLQQTYKNWMLIMCDDCSADNTYRLAEEYTKKYKNMILLKNEKNMGLNYTLNKCLQYVETEYVARMDGDDISVPERLQKEIEFLDKHKEYDIVSSSMLYFDAQGEWGRGKVIQKPEKKDFVYGTPFCHAPCMVRTAAYKKVQGYSVDKRLLRVEDYHLWYKMYLAGFHGYNLSEPLYKMRDDRNATSRRKYKYRVNEAYVKWLIVKDFQLPVRNYMHLLRPLIVGLLPTVVYERLHKQRMKG